MTATLTMTIANPNSTPWFNTSDSADADAITSFCESYAGGMQNRSSVETATQKVNTYVFDTADNANAFWTALTGLAAHTARVAYWAANGQTMTFAVTTS